MRTPVPLDLHGTALIGSNNWVTRIIAKIFCRQQTRHYAYLLYQYLRAVDDFIDDPGIDQAAKARFLDEQYTHIRSLHDGGPARTCTLLAWIARYNHRNGNVLKEDIMRMLAVFGFDVRRRGKAVSAAELETYSMSLARSYAGVLLYFIDPECEVREDAVLIAHACHMAHMLRDHLIDLRAGYLNIPREDLERFDIVPGQLESKGLRSWVKSRIETIEAYLRDGKERVLSGRPLRIILIACLYCFRYEIILRRLRESDFILQHEYRIRMVDAVCFFYAITLMFARFMTRKLFSGRRAAKGGKLSS
jgi:phytoene/squalene synthetase